MDNCSFGDNSQRLKIIPVILYTEACSQSELSEICNHDFAVVFEKDVFTFQIGMYNTTRVKIAHCLEIQRIFILDLNSASEFTIAEPFNFTGYDI